MNKLKIYYFYSIFLIKNLKLPVIMAMIAILTFLNRNSFPDKTIRNPVFYSQDIGGGVYYNNYYHSGGEVKFLTSIGGQVDFVEVVDIHPLNVIQWVLFGLSLVGILIFTIHIYIDDVEIIRNTEMMTTMKLSQLELGDDGNYYYVCLDRIVGRPSGYDRSRPNWKDFPRISRLRFHEKFYSKSKNRISNLNKIGI